MAEFASSYKIENFKGYIPPSDELPDISFKKALKDLNNNPFLGDDSAVSQNTSQEKKTPMYPSKQEYKGEKVNYEKGALRKIIETTQNLTIEQTIEKLEKYTKPSKESGDMFEMVALYQRSIQHLTILKIRVDARFGPRTFEKLMKTQKEVLKFE